MTEKTDLEKEIDFMKQEKEKAIKGWRNFDLDTIDRILTKLEVEFEAKKNIQ